MSGRGTDEDGEMESRVEFGETKETVLLSEGANGLTARWMAALVVKGEGDGDDDAGAGGARPLPLPKMRPPPSLRPDMSLSVDCGGVDGEREVMLQSKRWPPLFCWWSDGRTREGKLVVVLVVGSRLHSSCFVIGSAAAVEDRRSSSSVTLG